jgi:hypothetical protein
MEDHRKALSLTHCLAAPNLIDGSVLGEDADIVALTLSAPAPAA